MGTAADSEGAWKVAANGRARSLVVVLRQKSYVLPWSLFLYAEGTDAEVRAVFHTHVVVVQGGGLTSLLSDFAEQAVRELAEPERMAKFTQSAEPPHLTSVAVSETK